MEGQITGMAVTAFVVAAGLLALTILKKGPIILKVVAGLLAVTILLGSAMALYALCIEPSMLTVTQREISSPRLPQSFEGKKVAFISDIHLGKYYGEKEFAGLAARIDALHPDIVLIGGDIVDNSESGEVDPIAIGKLIRTIHAPLGIYAVEGNHDIEDRNTRAFTQKVYAAAGVRLLSNESVLIKSGGGQIAIAGLQESFFHKPDADKAYKGIPEGTFTIGMVHQPDIAVQFAPHKTELVLSGHTHGGIAVLPFYGPVFKVADGMKMIKGVYKVENTEVYVSNGIGFVILKARLGAPAEIVVYTLTRGNKVNN